MLTQSSLDNLCCNTCYQAPGLCALRARLSLWSGPDKANNIALSKTESLFQFGQQLELGTLNGGHDYSVVGIGAYHNLDCSPLKLIALCRPTLQLVTHGVAFAQSVVRPGLTEFGMLRQEGCRDFPGTSPKPGLVSFP